jgi:TonB family protein
MQNWHWVLFLCVTLLAWTAAAQTASQRCDSHDPDVTIPGCTELIQSGQQPTTPPDIADAYNNRGLAYDIKGDYDRAIQDFDEAIRLKPSDFTAFNNRGLAYSHKGDYDRAIKDYNQAIQLEPDYADAFNNRGVAYRYKVNYDRAIKDYNQAIRLKADLAEAFNNRGLVYRLKGDSHRAMQDYDEAIRLKPDFAVAYYQRGLVYGSMRDYEHAIEDLDQAVRLKPDYAWAFYYRGLAKQLKGDEAGGAADITRAKQLDPNVAPTSPPISAEPPVISWSPTDAYKHLVKQTVPVYAEKAKDNRIQGTVKLLVRIDTAGLVKQVTVLEGPKELIDAAVDAVKQWKYKPATMPDGSPAEAEFSVNVNFELQGG